MIKFDKLAYGCQFQTIVISVTIREQGDRC